MERNDAFVVHEGALRSYGKQESQKVIESGKDDSDVQIIEVTDIHDEENSESDSVQIVEVLDIDEEEDSEEDSEGDCEGDSKGDSGALNDQLCEDFDNGNETNELVLGLGLSRRDFLKQWKQLSRTAHESVEWRKKNSGPCTACNKTLCKFANSGTLTCVKCLKGRKACSIRIGFIADKMAQIHGSKEWIDRAVAHNWHKVRKMKMKKHADGAGPSLMKEVHKQMSGFEKPELMAHFCPSMETPHLAAKISKSAQDRQRTVPAGGQTSRTTASIQELENRLRERKERYDEERATWYKERKALKERIRELQQELDEERKEHREIRRYKGQQETAPGDVLQKKLQGRLEYELDKSNLLSTSNTNNATETESELETLRAKQDMWIKEKDRLKVKIRTVESAVEEKQRDLDRMRAFAKEAESKRYKTEKDMKNMERKMKDVEKATEGVRRTLNDVIICGGGDTTGASDIRNSGLITDTGLPSTAHHGKLRLQGHFLSGMDNQKQMDLHKNQSEGVKLLEKEDKISRACIEIVDDQIAVFEKVKTLHSKGRSIGSSSRSEPIDSSTAWWRGAALFNQFQINLIERERFTLSSGLGSYLGRLKSLCDQAKNPGWLDPLLHHELNIITESLISLHGHEQSSDIQQARNRLLFPHKHYLESDAEALERQIRRFEEIRHETRNSEASRTFSWIDSQWLNLHGLGKRVRQGESDTNDLPPAKRHHDSELCIGQKQGVASNKKVA